MAGSIKFQAGTLATVSGSPGTLATNTRLNVGTFDNTAALAPTVDLVLFSGFSVAPTPGAGVVVACYLVPYVDGTNAGAVDSSTPRFPSGAFVGNFVVINASTTPQYMPIQGVALSALKYDVWVDNQTGQTMSASWTLKAQPTLSQYT